MSELEKLLTIAAIDTVLTNNFGNNGLMTEKERTQLSLRAVEFISGESGTYDDLPKYYIEIGRRLISEVLPEESAEETEVDANHSES